MYTNILQSFILKTVEELSAQNWNHLLKMFFENDSFK